jgi:hypothetical protein
VTLFLVATIFVLAVSIDLASSKEEAVALTQLHRSFGVSLFGRLAWRQFSRFPNWPADMPQAMRLAAQGERIQALRPPADPADPRRNLGAANRRGAGEPGARNSSDDRFGLSQR